MIKIRHGIRVSLSGLIATFILYYFELAPIAFTRILTCLFIFAPCSFIFGYDVVHYNAITKKLEQEEKKTRFRQKRPVNIGLFLNNFSSNLPVIVR